jgi:3-isopropylmalate dehydrogenase
MHKNIAVLPGDGIGPEVIREALLVLDAVATRFNHQFTIQEGLIGAAAIRACGNPYPDATHALCLASDAILFGAVGDPAFENDTNSKIRPEQGLLRMRKELGLFANMRPVKTHPALFSSSPIKPEVLRGVDLVIFRELTAGLYYGNSSKTDKSASDTCSYSRTEIEKITKLAFEAAMQRGKNLTLVDKANVLSTSRLWREVVTEISLDYPEVTTHFMYVDNAAMQLMLNPRQFDVVLTENMFGDILSDEASVLCGSLGMLPSASFGEKIALYEPIHGSYPEAAGRNIANPCGAILSVALMLDYSFGLTLEAAWVTKAVQDTLSSGSVTADIRKTNAVTTTSFGMEVVKNIYQSVMDTV